MFRQLAKMLSSVLSLLATQGLGRSLFFRPQLLLSLCAAVRRNCKVPSRGWDWWELLSLRAEVKMPSRPALCPQKQHRKEVQSTLSVPPEPEVGKDLPGSSGRLAAILGT